MALGSEIFRITICTRAALDALRERDGTEQSSDRQDQPDAHLTDAQRRRQWRRLAGTARWDEPDHLHER